jgi:drug/metabolite transporter (DMT)-like permease
MPIAAVFLVLTGALIHALWNNATKKAGGDARFAFFCAVVMFAFWSPFCLWLGWHVVPTWGWKEWTAIAVSGFVHWLYFICLLTGYRKSDLTVVYPVACYTILDAWAVKVLALSPILFDYWCNILRMPYSAVPVLRDVPEAKRLWKLQWRYAAIVGIFSPIGYVLVLYAAKIAPVSHVAPAREVSMLFAALIGGQLLGETDRGLRILGACCIAAGVMALALG